MSIIKSTFENLEKVNSKALVTYTVAGDPNLDTSEKIISETVSSGVDGTEIGIPFRSYVRGPCDTNAHERSLINKTSLLDILSLSKNSKKFKTLQLY